MVYAEPVELTCPTCSRKFETRKERKAYCSPPCQKRAHQRRYIQRIKESGKWDEYRKIARTWERGYRERNVTKRKLGDRFRMSYPILRKIIIELLGNRCKNCGTTEDLIIHHVRYGLDIGAKDVVCLCTKCHILHHPKYSNASLRFD